MSTRAAIILRLSRGTYAGIYCHNDGYCHGPHGVGYHLMTHYQDPEKVRALTELGHISSLHEKVDPDPGIPHKFDGPRQDDVTIAYMRDRGEKDNVAHTGKTAASVARKIGHDNYVYVFEDGAWKCNGIPIAEAVALEDKEVTDQRAGVIKYWGEVVPKRCEKKYMEAA